MQPRWLEGDEVGDKLVGGQVRDDCLITFPSQDQRKGLFHVEHTRSPVQMTTKPEGLKMGFNIVATIWP